MLLIIWCLLDFSFSRTKFQGDVPTMPFLSGILEKNLCQLMKMFLRAAFVDEATTPYKLIKLDLQKKDNFLPMTLLSSQRQLKYFWHHLKQVQHKN